MSQLTVRSADGTTIAADLHGGGEPLVLVHGMASSSFAWEPLIPELQDRFTIIAVQRRGRGDSGDTLPYSIEREAEDLVAVMSEIGQPTMLFGHSYGANVALEAALAEPSLVSHMYLYEASVKAAYPDGSIERLEGLIEGGDLESATEVVLREGARLGDEEVAVMRNSATWPARVATVTTVPREMRAEMSYIADPTRGAGMLTPTMLLVGEDSDPSFRRSMAEIEAALPICATQVLIGHGHAAHLTAPATVAAIVTSFAG